jgi:dTMP kinase
MSFIVAIEGGDGAGKATASDGAVRKLGEAGYSAEVISFPRYASTVGGHALGEFLSGRLPRKVSPKAAAVLYALDRLESVAEIQAALRRSDVIIMDRYIASNLAYQGAKVKPSETEDMMEWTLKMEAGLFKLPRPGLSIYLDTPLELAQELILRKRPREYTERGLDEHEVDLDLQRRVRDNYSAMVDRSLLGPWIRIPTVSHRKLRPAEDIADEIAAAIIGRLEGDQDTSRPISVRA